MVVGYDFWKNTLDGAADAVGRVIRISGTPVTIVGVMPRGYGFPQRNGIWRPLHLERIPEASPSLRYVFGRLAPDHPREEATAQAATIGARAATMFPETNKNVRLQVLSLPDAVSDLPDAAALMLTSVNGFLVLLAALLCGNVAMLLFARAVSRERELVVRAALGASRGRLIMQFFAEALVLCAVGAAVGLLVARVVLGADLDDDRRANGSVAVLYRHVAFVDDDSVCRRSDAVRRGDRRLRSRAQSDVG